ncbi:hypothetical protein [Sciscionella marina]|uniref:hypothetical protein n=1 Tax=Sciscionella marina TaxID=508770 RepID=UPI00039D4093|nr:hypothetical protein [Sciscionella marina]
MFVLGARFAGWPSRSRGRCDRSLRSRPGERSPQRELRDRRSTRQDALDHGTFAGSAGDRQSHAHLEVPVKNLLAGTEPAQAADLASVDDPDALRWYARFAADRFVSAR